MNTFIKTADFLRTAAAVHDSILVSYSGGKDSLVILDLCSRVFKRVVCFFMYFIPGLPCIEEQLFFAKERYRVEIVQYPHWLLIQCLKNGIYCPNHYSFDDIQDFKLGDIYKIISKDTGIDLIATGAKKSDSLWRRRNLSTAKYTNVIYPIQDWNKFDVLAYLRTNNIPIPDSSGGLATGIDLSTPSILWLHDKHPDDFKKLLEYFPYAEAVVKRRDWYGVR